MFDPKQLEGRLKVRLGLKDGRVGQVSVTSTRPVLAAKILEGRSPDQAVELISMMYAMCGTAQGCAALAAMEDALNVDPGAGNRLARDLLRLAELAEQNALRMMLDWPTFIGEQPQVAGLIGLRSVVHLIPGLLYEAKAWRCIGGGRLKADFAALHKTINRVEAEVRGLLFDAETHGAPDVSDLPSLQGWWRQGQTVVARALAGIEADGLESFGCSNIEPLPALDLAWLNEQLRHDEDGSFASAPNVGGRVFEAGPAVGQGFAGVLAEVTKVYDNGLLTRMVQRLLALIAVPGEMRAILDALEALGDADLEPAREVDLTGSGTGIGRAETARGRLYHRVEVADGAVKRYQTVAPTEWNFHPNGPLAKGLAGVEARNAKDLKAQAALLVTALDPCVAFDVSVEE